MLAEIEVSAIEWLQNRTFKEFERGTDLFVAGILDSLSFNEFLAFLEEKYSVTVDLDTDADWRELVSVAAVAKAVENRIGR